MKQGITSRNGTRSQVPFTGLLDKMLRVPFSPAFNYQFFEEEPNEVLKPEEIQAEVEEQVNSFKRREYTGKELLEMNLKELPTLWEPIFPKVGVACVAGSSDLGKSSFLRDLAISISVGEGTFLGYNIHPTHRSAIYLSTEDDPTAISFSLNKYNSSKQYEPGELDGLRFIFEYEDPLQTIEKSLKEKPADVVIIDAFSDLYDKNMNEANQVRSFLNPFSQLAFKYQCLVLFLHHTGKRTELGSPSKHNLLGSQAFEAKMRVVIELRKDPIEEDIRHLCIVKGNYLPSSLKAKTIELKFSESLTFEATGGSKPFEYFQISGDVDLSKKELAKSLRNEGKSFEQIANEVGVAKSTIHGWAKKGGWEQGKS